MGECLGCNLCELLPVVLSDGRTVCNTCEDYRHECEVREVAGWDSNEKRKSFLLGVAEKRGKAAADRLRKDVWTTMKKQVLT